MPDTQTQPTKRFLQLARRLTLEAVETLAQGNPWTPKVVFETSSHRGSLIYPGAQFMRLDLWLRYAKVALRRQKAHAFALASIAHADQPAIGELVVAAGDSHGQVVKTRYYIPSEPGMPVEPVLQLPGDASPSPELDLLSKPSAAEAEVEQGISWFEQAFLQIAEGSHER